MRNFAVRWLVGALIACLCSVSLHAATLLPLGEQCFQATTPTSGGPGGTGTGLVGLLGTITGGSGYTTGTYGGVPLTGGSGTNATANITVSGGAVTVVAILNPGVGYVVSDVLSAAAANIGGTGSGFSVPVSSISINSSLAGGTVGYFIPNTLSVKQTWQDAAQTILNTNPVQLDSNGCAIVYGAGTYRQILKDSLGNTVWDKLTASTDQSSVFWAGLAGGTPNAITVTDANFSNTDGQTIAFIALATNTGSTTISVSTGTPIPVFKNSSSGPVSLSGGEIATGNVVEVVYIAASLQFQFLDSPSRVPLLNRFLSFTTAGTSTYTPPATGVDHLDVIVCASGGAGGGALAGASAASFGSGGGAGGCGKVRLTNAQVTTPQTITIGAGGVPAIGGTGGNGNASSFGALLSCTGGAGGNATPASTVALTVSAPGGTCTGANELFTGGVGGEGFGFWLTAASTGSGVLGNGGPSYYGPGGFSLGVGQNGNPGTVCGSGGSGAGMVNSVSAFSGGAGAPGCAYVYEFTLQ